METMSVQRSPGKQVSGMRPFKNPRRRSSRGSLSRSGGCLAPSWGSSPAYPPPPANYSQPPLLPLPRVNSSTLPLQRVNSSCPRVNSAALPCSQTIAKSETQHKKVDYVEYVPRLTRTGSVPVWTNHQRDFPKGFDGYPGPAILLLSPPPSSLPMPKFTIKSKLRCNAEAAGKTDVATDNIRRVLQLR
ncbi:T205 protein [Hirschfeldia incana]|nr:T205 protein [Hirschfeldia incana]